LLQDGPGGSGADDALGTYLAALAEEGALSTGNDGPDLVAAWAADLFETATGAPPTQNNERDTRFTIFLAAIFDELGISRSARHPARRAVARRRTGRGPIMGAATFPCSS